MPRISRLLTYHIDTVSIPYMFSVLNIWDLPFELFADSRVWIIYNHEAPPKIPIMNLHTPTHCLKTPFWINKFRIFFIFRIPSVLGWSERKTKACSVWKVVHYMCNTNYTLKRLAVTLKCLGWNSIKHIVETFRNNQEAKKGKKPNQKLRQIQKENEMKSLKKKKKHVCYLFIFIVLFYSYSLYSRTSGNERPW